MKTPDLSNTFCPVCLTSGSSRIDTASSHDIQCEHCGSFKITDEAFASLDYYLKDSTKRELLSHWIRKAERFRQIPILYTYTIKEILKSSPPSVDEQIDNFILYLADNPAGPGELVEVSFKTHGSIAGSKTDRGFALILDYLYESELIVGHETKSMVGLGQGHYALSVAGWIYRRKLLQDGSKSKKAFMAMQFGDLELNEMLDTVFRPSVLQAGYILNKLDDEPKAGLIDDRMRTNIRTSRFLLADLTHQNPGAYWEAGFAEGLGKPVIYLCNKSNLLRVKNKK